MLLTETNKEIFLSKLREIENYISEKLINKAQDIQFPIGAGFGTSAASALSLLFYLNVI